jgi:hypothetical protein
MSPQEQALLEGRAIVAAHMQVFANLVDNWAAGPMLLAQLEKLTAATQAYASLPRPQQKAA